MSTNALKNVVFGTLLVALVVFSFVSYQGGYRAGNDAGWDSGRLVGREEGLESAKQMRPPVIGSEAEQAKIAAAEHLAEAVQMWLDANGPNLTQEQLAHGAFSVQAIEDEIAQARLNILRRDRVY